MPNDKWKDFPEIRERRRPLWVHIAIAYLAGLASAATWTNWSVVVGFAIHTAVQVAAWVHSVIIGLLL